MIYHGYWSNASMLFYIILGIYTICVVYEVKTISRFSENRFLKVNSFVVPFVMLLTIIAAFRLVNYGIGGSDAVGYIFFFEKCNSPNYANYDWFLHQDILFRYLTKFLRLFSDDYHFYFFIIYGFNTVAYILFLIEFCPKKSSYIPCLLMVFLYWRSFSSLRSNTAIAVIMIALILLNRKQLKTAICVASSAILVHKMAALYFLFFPFYFIFTKYKLTKTRFVIVMIMVVIAGSFFQSLFLDLTENVEMGGAYRSYASRSLNTSFWDNGWKIAFEQILLGICMWHNYRKIQNHIKVLHPHASKCLYTVWMMCLFDMMTIPINFIMGVWRGYEFFYLPRIVMWCEILYLINKEQSRDLKSPFSIVCFAAFTTWMVFRFYNMWESSNLMPYIFEPFY